MIEEWKDIPGYEGLYQVSNLGKVKSLPRQGSSGKILKFRKCGNYKHLGVVLYKNQKATAFLIHRLVLLTFVGPCPQGLEARHLNGNGSDNKLNNLLWDTHSVNMQDRKLHGTTYNGNQRGSANPGSKLNEQQILQIREYLKTNKYTGRYIAELFGVSQQTICCIKTGRNWGWLNG